MQEFLDALTPALRGQVEAAIEDPEARRRLEWTASRHIDDEGNWPDDRMTAQTIAQQFLHRQSDYEGQRYGSSGLGGATAAALAGGAVALGTGRGLTVLSTKLMSDYWDDVIGYSTGLNPYFIRQMKKVYDHVAEGTPWASLTEGLNDAAGPSAIDRVLDSLIGERFARSVERQMYGVFRRAAWRGTRSALYHTTGMTVGDPSEENAWVEQHVRNFAKSQENLSRRTIVSIINDALERGQGSKFIAERLENLWSLSPRHALAVENYRKGLIEKERPVGAANRLARQYASRLHTSRLQMLSESEMHTAFNLGREAQWVQAMQAGTLPVGTKKMWVTARDEQVCPICRPLDGVAVDIGETFSGETNVYVPGAHPRCRCIVVPVSSRRTADFSREKKLIFPAQTVSKHLIGRHNQKTHGRDQHTSSQNADSAANIAAVGLSLGYMAAIGFMALPGGLPNMSLQSVKNFPSASKNLFAQYAKNKEGVKQLQALPTSDKYQWLGEFFNTGGKVTSKVKKSFPEAGLIEDGIRMWTSGSQGKIRKYLVTGGTGDKTIDALGMAVATAPQSTTSLFRGFDASGDVLKAYTTKGNTFNLGPTGFSSQKNVAQKFASNKYGYASGGEPVMFTLRPNARALRIEKHAHPSYQWEKEWLSSGRFRVANEPTKVNGVWQVEVEQVDLLIPNVLKLPNVQTMKAAGEEVSAKIGTAKISSTGGILSPADMAVQHGPLWWQKFGISNELIEQSGVLSHGWSVKAESLLALTKRRDDMEKRLIRVKEYERDDGTVVESHFRNLPGEDRSEDLRKLKTGAYDMPMSWLRSHVRGSGIRLGQRNRIRSLANSILGEGFTKPITMWIYDDGPFIKDGMHRLEAANLLGMERIPVAIKHVEGEKPRNDIRGFLAARRIRRQTPEYKRDTPFRNVKQEQNFIRWFNDRMSGRGEQLAEDDDPKRRRQLFVGNIRKSDDVPVSYFDAMKELTT